MKTPLKLFRVTLDWPDEGCGAYSSKLWAKDRAAAVLSAAKEMADADKISRSQRAAYIKDLVDNSGPEDVEDMAIDIKHAVHELLAGPAGEMSEKAKHAQCVILDLLALYGGGS